MEEHKIGRNDGSLSQIIMSVVVILGIFGAIFMVDMSNSKNLLLGVVILMVCGGLIFLKAFINKHSHA